MGLIGSMAVAIIGDVTGLDKELKKAKRKLDDFASTMTSIGTTLTMGLTVPIVAAGAAGFKLAADMQDAMGATDQIFKGSSAAMQAWAMELPTYYGIASGEAMEYANMMGSMLQNIGGMTEEAAAAQAQTLIKLAGDLTAMYGGTTADAVRALTGALKGNNTMLDNYGMAVNDAMITTKAMEMGLLSEGKTMDLATKQAATLALIMEQTGAAQGQAEREAAGASGSMRALTTEAKNLAASFGQILLPIITPTITRLGDLARSLSGMTPATQKIVLAVAALAAAIGPVMLALGGMAAGLSSIIALSSSLSGVLAGAGLTLGALVLPIAAIVAAIVGIGLAIKELWDNNVAFRVGVTAIWNDIQKSIAEVIAFIQELWDNHGDHLVKAATAIWDAIKTIISTVTRLVGEIIALFLNVLTGDWQGAWDNIKNIFSIAWQGIIGVLKNMVIAIKEIFIGLIEAALSWGENMLSSFIQGIKNKFSDLVDMARDIADTVADFIGFSSPTKKGPGRFIEVWGANMVKAFVDGVVSEFGSLQTMLGNMAINLNPNLAVAGGGAGGTTINMTVYATSWADIERELNRRGVRI